MDTRKMLRIWTEMKNRCDDTANPFYEKYGGIGIGYQESWKDFDVFYDDMKTENLLSAVLGRIDSTADYSKENCYWMDILSPVADGENYRQRARVPKEKTKVEKFYYYNGMLNDVVGFSIEYNISYITLRKRLSRGWSIERALTEPVHKRQDNKN